MEARKEVALPIVDDGVVEGDEAFDLKVGRAARLPTSISLRQADGSVCPDGGCAVSVMIADDDGPAVARITITPVPPAASADHGPYYPKDDFLALPDGAVHGRDGHADLHAQPRHRGYRYWHARTGARPLRPGKAGALHRRLGHKAAHLRLDGGGGRQRPGRAGGQIPRPRGRHDSATPRATDLLPGTVVAQRFAEHRVRGGLHAMRLDVSGMATTAREGEPFTIRVVRDGGFDEVAVALLAVTDSALPHIPQLAASLPDRPGAKQVVFRARGKAGETGTDGVDKVRVAVSTLTPVGDGIADESRTLTVLLAIVDAGINGRRHWREEARSGRGDRAGGRYRHRAGRGGAERRQRLGAGGAGREARFQGHPVAPRRSPGDGGFPDRGRPGQRAPGSRPGRTMWRRAAH